MRRVYDVRTLFVEGSRVLMTMSVPLSGTELAVIRRLRTTAAAQCARSRLQPHRRELLRDALVTEAERRWNHETDATVVSLPRQLSGRVLQPASA